LISERSGEKIPGEEMKFFVHRKLLTLYRSAPVGIDMVQSNPLALNLAMDDTEHEYEDVNVVLGRLPARPTGFNITPGAIPRSDTEGEIDTSPCPAYVATTKSVHLETEYEVIIPTSVTNEDNSPGDRM
jgi:hypothetical protein